MVKHHARPSLQYRYEHYDPFKLIFLAALASNLVLASIKGSTRICLSSFSR
jgi:hypothetical protein